MNIYLDGATAAAGAGMPIWMWVIYLVIIFGFMYLIVFRPQKKEQKRMAELLKSVEIGDSIVTSGGFYGVVIDVTDEDVIVEFGNNKNCRIPMKKSAIAQVEKATEE